MEVCFKKTSRPPNKTKESWSFLFNFEQVGKINKSYVQLQEFLKMGLNNYEREIYIFFFCFYSIRRV